MRVLVVSNMAPDEGAPWRGSFVRDQVAALRRGGTDAELHEFAPGKRGYAPAVRRLRRLLHGRGKGDGQSQGFDLVHAHYGLTGWCASLAGADPLVVTFHGTDVRHPTVGRLSRRLARRIDLTAGASPGLFADDAVSGRPGLPRGGPHPHAVLPCGADLERFGPGSRSDARQRLGLDANMPLLLFPASSGRPEKRFDRAREVAQLTGATLHSAEGIAPEQMPDWVKAANAVLVTSDYEGFGLAAVEALASNVPVLSTPVGIAPALLRGLEGCLAADFDAEVWAAEVRPHLEADDPHVDGRARVEWLSADRMAARVAAAYAAVLA